MGPVLVQSKREGQYLILQFAPPGRPTRNIGILLLDTAADRVVPRLRDNFEEIADPEDQELLALLEDDLRAKASETGGEEFLRYLEDTLSNTLLITQREAVEIQGSMDMTLDRLMDRHVEKAKVVRFKTHLPLYSLRAAAGGFGEDMSAEEAEDWVKVPERIRLSEDMFVAQVVGHSMEPRIPDGSFCVFRANVVGSRQGKLVLVELFGATDFSARYTVKRYTSKKVVREDEWHHESIRLEPLNPDYEPLILEPDQFRVIGEFVAVLE